MAVAAALLLYSDVGHIDVMLCQIDSLLTVCHVVRFRWENRSYRTKFSALRGGDRRLCAPGCIPGLSGWKCVRVPVN